MKSHVHFLPGDMKDEQKGNPTHQHVGTVRHAYTIFIHRKMGSQAGPFLSSNINNWETYSICHIHTKKKSDFIGIISTGSINFGCKTKNLRKICELA